MITLSCDIGTSSIRVAIFEYSSQNALKTPPLAVETELLTIYNKQTDFYEQKTTEIWKAFCKCVSKCLIKTGLNLVNGLNKDLFPLHSIAISATCSLVVIEDNGNDECDVIMWMDHRAKREAAIINETKHKVLDQFGGICSPEFSLSKLLWLFRNQRDRFDSANGFMELSDWLTYRCSEFFKSPENFPRSICCVTCKWGYDSQNKRWPADLFEELGIPFVDVFQKKIGVHAVKPGYRIGSLSCLAAKEIGFEFNSNFDLSLSIIKSVSLSSSLIDAHSGVVSMLVLSKYLLNSENDTYEDTFCMISGTSTCHMVLNKDYASTKGVWGPYLDAIIPGYYLREAGQSATGKLIDHVIDSYYDGNLPSPTEHIIAELNLQLKSKQFNHRNQLIVNPSFHGNRSPIADSRLKGAIYGFSLEKSSLLDLYVATVEAIAYETKFIMNEIEKNSKSIRKIIVSGGLTKNELYLQLHADILGIELITFNVGDANLMLVGGSIIAFTAFHIDQTDDDLNHQKFISLLNNIRLENLDEAQANTRIYKPRNENLSYHENKYKCYRLLLECCSQMENILSGVN